MREAGLEMEYDRVQCRLLAHLLDVRVVSVEI